MRSIDKTVLFSPASGPTGSGEYYRCLNIARAMVSRAEDLDVHFLLHREASVELESDFQYHQIEATPSRATQAVSRLIELVRPDLAVFDCTGRVRHFRQVKRQGGRVVWISNRPGKRRRGFRPRVIATLHRHVIADTETGQQQLSLRERLLQRLIGACHVSFANTVTPELDPATAPRPDSLARLPTDYALFVSGGGGYEWHGQAVPEVFVEAAAELYRRTGLECVVVLGPQYSGEVLAPDGIHLIPAVKTRQLSALMAHARCGVAGGGFMISSQVLATRLPAVLVAVGGHDQPARIRRLASEGLVLAAQLPATNLAEQAERLVRDPALAAGLVNSIERRGIRNDVGLIAEQLLADLVSGD
jgi:hypothetical protein